MAYDIYLFAHDPAASVPVTSVYRRNYADSVWYYSSARNPDSLFFRAFTNRDTEEPGYSPDGHFYGDASHGAGPVWAQINIFDRIAQIIREGPEFDAAGSVLLEDPYAGFWAEDIADGTGQSVVWTQDWYRQRLNWTVGDPVYTAENSTAYWWMTPTASDFTAFPKNLINGSAGGNPTPFIRSEGGALFRYNDRYWQLARVQFTTTDSNGTFAGWGLLRGDVDALFNSTAHFTGTSTLLYASSNYVPTLSESDRTHLTPYAGEPTRWQGCIVVPYFGQNKVERIDDANAHYFSNANNLGTTYLLRSDETVVKMFDLPNTHTYEYSQGVFHHRESGTLYQMVRYGSTAGGALTGMKLYELTTYDIGAGTFSWTEVGDFPYPYGPPVGDSEALYFPKLFVDKADWEMWRFDLGTHTMTQETISGGPSVEQLWGLIKVGESVAGGYTWVMHY